MGRHLEAYRPIILASNNLTPFGMEGKQRIFKDSIPPT
jgi:hypothetical protein